MRFTGNLQARARPYEHSGHTQRLKAADAATFAGVILLGGRLPDGMQGCRDANKRNGRMQVAAPFVCPAYAASRKDSLGCLCFRFIAETKEETMVGFTAQTPDKGVPPLTHLQDIICR